MRPFSILPAMLLLCFLPLRAAEGPEPLTVQREVQHPEGVTEIRFTNGLVLLCKSNRASSVVATRVFVRVGSIYEGDMLGSGVSHYFEHVISGGTTATRSEAESAALLQRIGNNSNAYTSRDVTVYYITTEATHFPTAADLLGDYMVNNLISEDEFNRERGVIIQEIRKNRDNPNRAVYQLLTETMFPHHPVGQPVIGHLNTFKAVTRDQVAAFYRRYYVANNTVVAVASPLPVNRVVAEIADAFAGYRRGTPNHPHMPTVPRQLSARWAEKESSKVGKAYLAMGHHTVTLDHPDLFALDVAADLLGKGRTSRLHRALREQGLVHNVYAYSHTPTYNAGVFGIGAVLDPDKLDAVLSSVAAEVRALQEELVDDEALRRAKKNKITDELFGKETAEAQASDVGYNYLTTGDPNFTAWYLEGIRRVTAADVRRVAQAYLDSRNRTIAVLRPPKPQAAAQPPQAVQERTPVVKITLDNGVRVLLGPDPLAESVNLQVTFLGGVLAERPEEAGVCQLMTTLLLKGTARLDKTELHQAIENMGARIWANSGNNSWYAGMKLLPDDFQAALEILADVVQHPRFPAEDFARERALQLRRLQSMDDNWQSEASRFHRATWFAGHPYARHPLGTAEALSALTLDQVRSHHKRLLDASHCVIAVFGRFEREPALEALRRLFALPARPDPAYTPQPYRRQSGALAVKTNQKDQVVLMWGFEGPAFAHPDTPAITVLDTIISGYGYPSGWLHHALRGSADLVYFVHAWNWAGRATGTFQIMSQTSPANACAVVDRVEAVLTRIREETVSPDELEAARESIVISDAIGNETGRARALRATFDELYGAGYDYHHGFADRIRAVTAADVRRVARTYLTHRVLTATGPADAVEPLAASKQEEE